MRKALHATDQASTIVNRGEAKTVLFPPPPATVAVPTQTVPKQETVAAGETTVVRPVSRRRVLPVALSAVALLLVACGVLAFFALKKRNEPEEQIVSDIRVATPSPSAETSVAPSPEATEAQTDEPTPAPTKQERQTRSEEARKAPTPKPDRDDTEDEGHSENPDVRVDVPDVPIPPEQRPPGGTPPRPTTQFLPGGTVIKTFPDGTQIITTRDGMRVMITKDGKRQVLRPARPNRPRVSPEPTPSP
jgi:N-methylhydantoinase A/oxoprolinase/acetone carboxylase beta subunit